MRAERHRLRDWLSTGIPIRWGKQVVAIDHDDAGVQVTFEDSTTSRGDILVGADGINSIGMPLHLLRKGKAQ